MNQKDLGLIIKDLGTGISANDDEIDTGAQGLPLAEIGFNDINEQFQKRGLSDADVITESGASLRSALTQIPALQESINSRMPHAPQDGRVFGGMGGNWFALEGTEERAVITVSAQADFTQDAGVILVENWDAFEIITVAYNGIQVFYDKSFSPQTLYAVGDDLMIYEFTFDPIAHTVQIAQKGVFAESVKQCEQAILELYSLVLGESSAIPSGSSIEKIITQHSAKSEKRV